MSDPTPDDKGFWTASSIAEVIANGLHQSFKYKIDIDVNLNRIKLTMSNGDKFWFVISEGEP